MKMKNTNIMIKSLEDDHISHMYNQHKHAKPKVQVYEYYTSFVGEILFIIFNNPISKKYNMYYP